MLFKQCCVIEMTQHWQALMAGIIVDGISAGAFREVNAQQVARQLSAM